ncbi:cytochrome p450 cyp749a22 [Quercus suber]|uniref:Cytochrome p450 cyp749a22 n=1 Tax=Quercus suber TaxID=58331 RepID=A0AAW0J5T8_QUESU
MILQRYAFTLSPAYVHSPFQLLTIRPQHGVQVMLHSLHMDRFAKLVDTLEGMATIREKYKIPDGVEFKHCESNNLESTELLLEWWNHTILLDLVYLKPTTLADFNKSTFITN